MTDILDYKIENLPLSVFDNALTSEQKDNYYDVASLISILTSPTQINYQLIADFFLTFRTFISQQSLLNILVLRIRWCIQNINDTSHESKHNIGKLTLVRTFVMIRHWLLNYFSEDFIPSQELRTLFIQSINSLSHDELFVQRIIGNLKQSWTFCCNKSWDEKINSEDFYHFEIRVGPQGNKYKRLSQFALSQQNDPITRNSIMLSTFNKNTVHRLPIPMSKREPKIVLNLKNSNHRFSRFTLPLSPTEANAPSLPPSSPIPTPTSTLSGSAPKTRPTLYTSLSSSSFSTTRSTIRDSTEFIKSPNLSKVLPPTPVKKMDFTVQVPQSPSNTANKSQRGLRPLIENWLKTFHLHSNEKLKENQRAETFMKSVVSVAKIDNAKLEALADGKFDILSARTIDELEYLVRFHNEILNKHGNKLGINAVNDSFSFTIDETSPNQLVKGVSNIDNMNICETISLISRSVISLQQYVEGDRRSYMSYDSKLSQEKIIETTEDQENLKKKGKIENFKEFNFEEQQSVPVKEDTTQESEDQLDNTPPQSLYGFHPPEDQETEVASVEDPHGEKKRVRDSDTSTAFSIISESTPNLADIESNADVETNDTTPEVEATVTAADILTHDFKSSETAEIDRLPESAQILEHENSENDNSVEVFTGESIKEIVGTKSELSSSRHSVGNDSDYDDIESFVSTYDEMEVEDMVSASNETGPNHSDYINEPNTPPLSSSNNGLISSTPQISPIKPIHESLIIDKQTQDSTLQGPSVVQVNSKLDLNRVPSFTRISNASISRSSSIHNQLEDNIDRHSYLSRRSNNNDHKRGQPSRGSVNSIFSTTAKNLVNVTIKHKSQLSTLEQQEPSSFNETENTQSDSLLDSINSEDYNIPYPGVDSEVIAELAAISDDSLQDDPISAALLKLEGSYTKRNILEPSIPDAPSLLSSIDSKELGKQVDSLDIHSTPKQAKRSSVFIDQRRKTKQFSLIPVKQKSILYEETSSRIMLDLLLSKNITNDILKISNSEQHIPFILNFKSRTLAEQFTLIEKDALLEIDWKELVELKWDSDQLVPINSWLELLIQNQDIHGVDLCVSRFNLTVNWIISEILLTKDLTIRKLTIQRFIHIAQNCKILQNYSTLMQILLALGSDKIMKLKDTWRIIEPGDILIYKNLEAISSPLKNFIVLRNELNKIKPSLGCVPFLGLYLSDLVFNKEKRSANGEKINFGKFKHDSKIVRSLIQCIQWSTLYRLKVDDEVLSKCLYIKALPEEEMNECLQMLLGQ